MVMLVAVEILSLHLEKNYLFQLSTVCTTFEWTCVTVEGFALLGPRESASAVSTDQTWQTMSVW